MDPVAELGQDGEVNVVPNAGVVAMFTTALKSAMLPQISFMATL